MLGIDIISVARVDRMVKRRWFTSFWFRPSELDYISTRANRSESISGAICAKEAVMKSIGRGFRQRIRPNDVQLHWTSEGKPFAEYQGRSFWIAISHSDGFALAVALERKANEFG